MSLTLYYHPLASYCWQPLIALYENDTPFKPYIVDLMDPTSAAAFKKVWPIGKFPVLRDEARGVTVPESTVVIEYLSQYYPGRTRLVPSDSDLAWRVRLSDRFYDHYVNDPMSKVVTDRIRPPGRNDPHGVEEARALLRISLDMVEAEMAGRTWAVGDAFTMADCAAAPALFYADKVMPLGERHLHAAGYLRRLMQRPSFARVLEEAEPYFKMFPAGKAQQAAAARPTQTSDPFVGLILRGGSEGGRQMSYIDVAIPAVAGLLAWARPEMFLRKPPDMRKLRLVRLFGILLLIVSAVYLAVRLAGL